MNVWLKLSAGLLALAALAAIPSNAFAADASHPTVVELFQSQGCSSCPPAAEALRAISDRPDILALSFAVDYWDRLGWKDTFSKHAWTERQFAYARAMGHNADVYTPQIVVNGRVAGVGAEPGDLAGLVRRGDRGLGGPSVGFSEEVLTVGAGAAPAEGADVWLVLYDPRTIDVVVRRGENAGLTLPHRDVVHDLTLLGRWDGQAARYPIPQNHDGWAEAAIVQTSGAKAILAAAKR